MNNECLFLQIVNSDMPYYSIIIDEEADVVYAFLLKHKEIVSDVWLYNTTIAPDYVDWDNPDLMPFLAPKGFTKGETDLIRVSKAESVKVFWGKELDDKVNALIFINDNLIAKLIENCFPGYCVNAIVNSRLANVL